VEPESWTLMSGGSWYCLAHARNLMGNGKKKKKKKSKKKNKKKKVKKNKKNKTFFRTGGRRLGTRGPRYNRRRIGGGGKGGPGSFRFFQGEKVWGWGHHGERTHR